MGSGKVLVVEDEYIVAADICATLQRLGYQALPPVASGERLLEVLHQEPPDVLLLDVSLQGAMDGLAAARAVRASAWSQTPIIFLTAYDDPATLRRLSQVNPVRCMGKPFTPDQLSEALREALSGRVI
jgi:CheY-like chemotaxis protein